MTKNVLKKFFQGFIASSLILLVCSFVVAFYVSQNPVDANADNDYTWDDSTKTVTFYSNAGMSSWADYTRRIENLKPYVKNMVFGPNVSEIGHMQFSGVDYPSVNSVKFQGNIQMSFCCFNKMTTLTSVVFEKNCHLIGHDFYECPNLNSVVFNGEAKIGTDYPSTTYFVGSLSFSNTSIKNLVFNGKAKLAGDCFSNISTLESVTFKDESDLSEWPLSYCENLKSIEFQKETHIHDGNPFVVLFYDNDETSSQLHIYDKWVGIMNGNQQLESLYFPANSTIENCPGLFSYYYKLKYVEFESAVSLDDGAFTTCPSLEEIIFNDSSDLGKGCFAYSYNLYPEETEHFPTKIRNINFGGPTKINIGCFSSYDVLNKRGAPNTALKNLYFPEGSDFQPSGGGGSNQGGYFSYFNALETVEFDGDVKLYHGAFQNNPSLKTVTFNKQSTLNNGAFSMCPNIEEINFCDAVKLGNGCFQPGTSRGTIASEVLNLPDSEWNTKLKSLKFPKGSVFDNEPNYQSAHGSFCAYKNLESIEFEGDVTLSCGCFYNLIGLKTLNFGGKAELRNGSFPNLLNLEEINFGDEVHMGYGCFSFDSAYSPTCPHKNESLKSISFPKGSTFKFDGNEAVGSFLRYFELENITFEGDIKVPNGCFQNCNAIRHVQFMGSSIIGLGSFVPCENLEELEFGGPTEIDSGSLQRDPKIENTDIQRQPTKFKNTKLKSLTIPEDSIFAASHSSSALFKCFAGLEEVTFKGNIELHGSDFNFCENLKKVNFEKKSVINAGAFAFCNNLEEINFGDATEIHGGAFYACDSEHLAEESQYINNALTSLTFPDGSIIGDTEENLDSLNFGGFFQNYKALENVTFEGKVVVGGGCFQYCDSLKNINFNGADSILTQGAFSYNQNLESVEFNNPIQILGGNFRFCPNLQNVIFNSDCTIAGESFTGDEANINTGLKKAEFNGDTLIKEDSFKDCVNLNELNFNGNVIIQDNAFSINDSNENTKLKEVNFAQDSKIQSETCFKNFVALEIIRFDDTSQTESSAGFINCPKLNDIYYTAIEPTGFVDLSFTNLKVETLKIHVPCISFEKYKDSLREDSGSKIMLAAVGSSEIHNINFVDNVVKEHQSGTEFLYDQDYHWTICTLCKGVLNKSKHKFSLEWKTDQNYHWHECTDCKYAENKEAHNFNNHVCLTCFYDERIEPISDDVIPAIQEFGQNPVQAVGNLVSTFDGKTWAIVGICILLVLANGFFITKKIIKKRKNK